MTKIKQPIRKRNVKLPKEEHEAGKIANASIPFIEEVRRIAQASGVESTGFLHNELRSGTIRLKIIYQKKHKQTLIDMWNVRN